MKNKYRFPYGEKKAGCGRKYFCLAQRQFVYPRCPLLLDQTFCKLFIRLSAKNKVDAIISTGPPHSMHLIANALSRKLKLPWIADFRDPWTNIDYYKDFKLTAWADKKHHALEKQVVTEATRVIVVGHEMKLEFENAFGRKVDLITNGYDEDDVVDKSAVGSGSRQGDTGFIIAHVGTLVRSRNPLALWKSLAALVKNNADFARQLQIRLTGKVDIAVRNSLREFGLENNVTYINYLPPTR
ncbi:MAG: glycosyltransferase [Bacteroidetes bacterium]|nr:glycosyltransferase [Bacteroidota bacterium]